MDEQQLRNDPLAAAYAETVEQERAAWQELHSHAPGTPGRIGAWRTWSDAISRTNDAWRKLSARRFARHEREPAQPQAQARAREHARA